MKGKRIIKVVGMYCVWPCFTTQVRSRGWMRRRCVCEKTVRETERHEDEEEEKHLDDEVSGWEKTRPREKDKK